MHVLEVIYGKKGFRLGPSFNEIAKMIPETSI